MAFSLANNIGVEIDRERDPECDDDFVKVDPLPLTSSFFETEENHQRFDIDQILGKGQNGTVVYRGNFQSRPVAVKRIVLETCSLHAEREIQSLLKLDRHPNIIRYIATEKDENFRYIAMELATGHLRDFVEGRIRCTLDKKEIFQMILKGLQFLHENRIVHRDVKPENVLIIAFDEYKKQTVKLSDFGLSKEIPNGHNSVSLSHGNIGTCGYIAPEIMQTTEGKNKVTQRVDIFSTGVTFFNCATMGGNPFGDTRNRLEVQYNISVGRKINLEQLKQKEAHLLHDLIKTMIDNDANKRPTSEAALKHVFFWPSRKKVDFIRHLADLTEVNACKRNPDGKILAMKLDAYTTDVIGVRQIWYYAMEKDIRADLQRKNVRYNYERLSSLLRALRNLISHINECSPGTQARLGLEAEDQEKYMEKTFPQLYISCIKSVGEFLSQYSKVKISESSSLRLLLTQYYTQTDPIC